MLVPNRDRLDAGPVEHFIVGNTDPEIPADGTGKKVGAAGRDVRVGMELVVDTVLVLLRPSRKAVTGANICQIFPGSRLSIEY